MIKVEEWLKESLEVRLSHIDMSEECLERGGGSTEHRGVLAHFLGTTFPRGKAHLCHYCGNGKCSNPKHLYWGTPRENNLDSVRHGTRKNGWNSLVEKLGEEGARDHMRRIGDHPNSGKGNKGKPKTEEHKRKIAANHKGGRKRKEVEVPCGPDSSATEVKEDSL